MAADAHLIRPSHIVRPDVTEQTSSGDTLIMGLDNSKLIDRWRYDATRALGAVFLYCHRLVEVIVIDLLNNSLKLYPLST